MPDTNKNLVDVAQIFQTYIAFNGDVDKCAVALDMPRSDITNIANREHWQDKITEWNKLRAGNPQDVQIQINRAVNYVQAHRLRALVDRVIAHLSTKTNEELQTVFTKTTKEGSEFVTRSLTDLVKASETCQAMTARALGDTAGRGDDEPGKGSNMMLMVMKAMSAADEVGLDSVEVVKKQLHQ